MAWIRSLYEKIKPYLWIPILLFVGYTMVSDIMGANRFDEQQRAFERTIDDLKLVRGELRDGLSDVSDIKEGVAGVAETARDLRDLGAELRGTSDRLDSIILGLGDSSTESGLYADRLYRISRELAEREQETEE